MEQHGAKEARPGDLRSATVNMNDYASCGEGLRGSLRSISVPVADRQSMVFEVQVMKKLEHLLGATTEITHDVKCLQQQHAHMLQHSMSQPSRDGKTSEPRQAQLTSARDKVDVSPKAAAGVAQGASGQDFNALKLQFSVLEKTLQWHMEKQCEGVEMRLEQHLMEVLKQCEACNASCGRVESMLECGTPSAKEAPSRSTGLAREKNNECLAREKMKVQTLESPVLLENIEGTALTPGDAIQKQMTFTPNEELKIVAGLKQRSFISENTGFAARGWIAEAMDVVGAGPNSGMTRMQILNRFSFVLVIVDLIMASILAHIEVQHAIARSGSPSWVAVFQLVIALGFTADLTARWCTLGSRFISLKDPDFKWNILDVLITGISLVDAVMNLANTGESLAHVTFFRLLRLLRLVRVANVFRKLRDLYEFGLIMECIANALLPITWSFLLLGFSLYVSTVLMLQLLEPHLHSGGEVDGDIVRLYGGFGRCIYTLLLAISGGTPWNQFVDPLNCLSGSFRFVFGSYVCLVNFFVLNILNAVFVSYVSRFVKVHFEQFVHDGQVQALWTAEELRELLQKESVANQGKISARRLEKILSKHPDMMDRLELNMQTTVGIFKMLHMGAGRVDVDDFVCSLMQLKGNPTGIHVVTLMYETKKIMLRLDKLSDLVNMTFATLQGDDSQSV